jgi:hypothetical protein
MGALGQREKRSERKVEACRRNARRPRGRWANTPEREQLEAAKSLLRECLPDGAERLAALIENPDTPAELFLQAFRLAADRGGLPVLAQSELITAAPYPPTFIELRTAVDVERELLPAMRLLAPDLAGMMSPDECYARLAAEVSRVCGLVEDGYQLPGSPRKAELPSAQLVVAGSDREASNPPEAGGLGPRLDAAGPR